MKRIKRMKNTANYSRYTLELSSLCPVSVLAQTEKTKNYEIFAPKITVLGLNMSHQHDENLFVNCLNSTYYYDEIVHNYNEIKSSKLSEILLYFASDGAAGEPLHRIMVHWFASGAY